MATAVTSKKLFANSAIITWDHDPGGVTAIITSPDGGTTKRLVALKDFEGFAVICMTTIATGGVTLVDIIGATDSSGTNATTVVTSGTVVADAVGDVVVVECTAAQVREVGSSSSFNFTHVGARITCSNAADEAAVTYIRWMPRFGYDALTANAIS